MAYDRAAGRAGLDIPITAADFCPEMLAIGRRKAQRAGAADRVEFVEADTQNLPFPEDHFQIECFAP